MICVIEATEERTCTLFFTKILRLDGCDLCRIRDCGEGVKKVVWSLSWWLGFACCMRVRNCVELIVRELCEDDRREIILMAVFLLLFSQQVLLFIFSYVWFLKYMVYFYICYVLTPSAL